MHVTALDRRLQQLSVRNSVVSPGNNVRLFDELTAQQEKNQMALMQLQQQTHALNKSRCRDSAVFSDFATPLQDLSCGPAADPEFSMNETGQIFLYFLAQIVHFGPV